jgi:hypothetical protein
MRVDLGARRERVVELEIADEIAQVRLRELRDRELEVGDVVLEPLGVSGLVVDDGVHADDHVVRRDHFLRRDLDDLLAHVDQVHAIDERHDDPQSRVDRPLVPPQALDDAALERAHDLDAAEREHEQKEGQDGQDDDCCHGTAPSAKAVSRAPTASPALCGRAWFPAARRRCATG